MKVSIIYVNYNTTELTVASIKSLERVKKLFDFEVIVVDNATTDFDEEPIKAVAPHAKIVRKDTNLGFGKGNNAGAVVAEGDYLWILNTDTIIPEDNHLEMIMKLLDKHSDYAAAGPLLVNDRGEIQPAQVSHFPTPTKTIMRIKYDQQELKSADVEVIVAASMFVRRSVFEEVGGFSPEFFFFFEDSDLCRKIWQAGYKVRFVAESKVIHLWGQSIKGHRSFSRRKQLYFDSQDVYLRKWHSPAAALLVKCLRWPLMAKYRLLNR